MDKLDLIVNQLPAPTWNRLRMNESRVAVAAPTDECEPKVALQGSVCLNKQQIPRIPGKNCCGCAQMATCPVNGIDFASMPTGMGTEMAQLGEGKRIHLVEPILPCISNLIKLFISTAYSRGSSLDTLSAKPLTIMALASSSLMPRLIK